MHLMDGRAGRGKKEIAGRRRREGEKKEAMEVAGDH